MVNLAALLVMSAPGWFGSYHTIYLTASRDLGVIGQGSCACLQTGYGERSDILVHRKGQMIVPMLDLLLSH